jgi:hypothetical protein
MLKVTLTTANGKKVLLIGLSFGNLDRLREEVGDTFIKIDPVPLGLSHEVLIFSGRTEADLAEIISKTGAEFTPDSRVEISDKLKN